MSGSALAPVTQLTAASIRGATVPWIGSDAGPPPVQRRP